MLRKHDHLPRLTWPRAGHGVVCKSLQAFRPRALADTPSSKSWLARRSPCGFGQAPEPPELPAGRSFDPKIIATAAFSPSGRYGLHRNAGRLSPTSATFPTGADTGTNPTLAKRSDAACDGLLLGVEPRAGSVPLTGSGCPAGAACLGALRRNSTRVSLCQRALIDRSRPGSNAGRH